MNAQAVVISIPQVFKPERILYATDFTRASERALPIVAAIARHYGSQVFLTNVWNAPPYPLPDIGTAPSPDQDAEALMYDLVRSPELKDLKTTVVLRAGGPVEQIVSSVQKHRIDLVILGTHGRTGIAHALMGSVAEELFRTLKCAVLTLGPGLDARFTIATTIERILFPTSFSAESKAVFPYLASLANEFKSEVVFLHVLSKEKGADPEVDKLAKQIRRQMEETFGSQLNPSCKAKYVVEFGQVAQKILSASDYYKSDLIGMGIQEGSELSTRLRATTAYRVAIGAQCPVLTARGSL